MSKHTQKKSKVLRVELELRSRFLQLYEIKDPYDFQKLLAILPDRHVLFVRFNRRKLIERLQGMRFAPKKVSRILEDVALLEGDVWATLNYLRQELHLANTRRLVDRMDVNDLVVDALNTWAAQWPTAPAKLRTKIAAEQIGQPTARVNRVFRRVHARMKIAG